MEELKEYQYELIFGLKEMSVLKKTHDNDNIDTDDKILKMKKW